MKTDKKQIASSGVAALALLAGIYGLTAVMARYFSAGTGVFEQWYLRYAFGFIFTLIIFRKKIRFRKFRQISHREASVLVLRTIVGSVIAVALYTLASQRAKIGTVAFMQVLPVTALLGVLLLHEKLPKKKALLVFLSFLGAAIVVVPSIHDLTGFSRGELLSFASAICFSFVFVSRKWHTGELNNQELTLGVIGLGMILNYACSLIFYHRPFATRISWSPQFALLLVGAGFLSTVMNFLINYGFERVSAVVASTILDLEQVFGVIFGYIFYRETLSVREATGGLVILLAVIIMNQLNNNDESELQSIPAPD